MISNLTTNKESLETTPETTAVSCTSTETQLHTREDIIKSTTLGSLFSKRYGSEVTVWHKGWNVKRLNKCFRNTARTLRPTGNSWGSRKNLCDVICSVSVSRQQTMGEVGTEEKWKIRNCWRRILTLNCSAVSTITSYCRIGQYRSKNRIYG